MSVCDGSSELAGEHGWCQHPQAAGPVYAEDMDEKKEYVDLGAFAFVEDAPSSKSRELREVTRVGLLRWPPAKQLVEDRA